jgi:hypothetical protein
VRDVVERFLARVRQRTDAELEALAGELRQAADRARHDLISRVVTATRRLDEATSLRGILDALADGAAAEATRLAVLLVDEETLRAYRHHGFHPGATPVDVPLAASRTLSRAVAERRPMVLPTVDEREIPALTGARAAGHSGLLLPVVVQRAVVALVYAEGPDHEGPEDGAPVWREQVEVLVRHASARLENVTSQRTVEVLTSPS